MPRYVQSVRSLSHDVFHPTAVLGYVPSPYSIAELRALRRLWQNTAKTVPAIADGDPVRVVDCGGGVDYTAPTDAARPLLWAEGAGRWSLSFDGVDDQIIANVNVTLDKVFATRVRLAASGNFPMIVVPTATQHELRFSGSTRQPQLVTDNTVGAITASGVLDLNTWAVLLANIGGSGNSSELRWDGIEVASDPSDTTTAATTTITIGARTGGSLFFGGRIAGVYIKSGKLSGDNLTKLEAYLGSL